MRARNSSARATGSDPDDPDGLTLGPGSVCDAIDSPGDARAEHRFRVTGIVESDGLAGGDASLRRGEPDGQPAAVGAHHAGYRLTVGAALGDRTYSGSGRVPMTAPGQVRTVVDPGHRVQAYFIGVSGLRWTQGHASRRNVYRRHEAAAPVTAVAHPPALPHGHQLDGFDGTEVVSALMVDQPARVQRQPRPEEAHAPLVRPDETDI